ncbi:MAG TPA: tetratricopeptide repeat protein [Candidatus Udaeobacter sp.]|nr:tetratricopeptide repeat protein [Candidatus Udaeobacter sp.]
MPSELKLSEQRKWLWGLFLIALVVVAYSGVVNAGFIWDDDKHLTRNACVVGPLGFQDIWTSAHAFYYPLVLTTFWFVHKFVGLNPSPYHMLNVVLHALSAIVLWRVLLRLNVRGAWLGAAIWALHPVMVQSVAWITELKNTQSCLLYLLSILCFLKWEQFAEQKREPGKRPKRASQKHRSEWLFSLSLIFFALATLSKTSVVMLPAVLALCVWWQNRLITWRDVVSLIPFAVISAVASAWTIWEQRFHSGATGPEWAQTWAERLIIVGRVPWFYLSKLIWPHRLIFIYPRWEIDPTQVIAWLPLLALLAGVIALWFVRTDGGRAAFFATTYYLLSLFPVLGFFSVYFFRYSFVSDHFQYLASMGPLALAGAGIVTALRWFEPAPAVGLPSKAKRSHSVSKRTSASTVTRQPLLLVLVSSVLIGVLGLCTWQQSRSYHDIKTLWQTTIAKNPGCWMAHNNLGNEFLETGDIDAAVAHFEKAFQLKPDLLEAHYSLINGLLRKGDADAAMTEARNTLSQNPQDAEAYGVLGTVFMTKGLVDEAIAQFSKALEIRPNLGKAHYNLAIAMLDKHETDKAIDHYEKALEAEPNYLEAMTNLAWVLATSTETVNRNGPKAVELAERANHLTGDINPLVLRTLAAAYASDERFDQAIETSRRALRFAQDQRSPETVEGIRREMSLYETRRHLYDVQ